jgi:eukaryotic-like serine/threonine-protein kinase
MDSARWNKIRELFEEARNLQQDSRQSYLDEACQGDANLQEEIKSLLSQHDQANGVLDAPALGQGVDVDLNERDEIKERSHRIGRYLLKRVIGSGGMGVVWEALQDKPHRIVALKVMKSGVTSSNAIKRFWYETEILGRLTHPGIAQIFEADIHREADDLGGGVPVPYFAMEFVAEAKTIIEYARTHGLGVRQCLEIFVDVCDAVQYGHQNGVIHRDIKPANILVDSSGHPKIIDFGVARATDADVTVTTVQTGAGQLVGTVQYMSPEQCDAKPDNLDIRTDVYSLGVVLYELLCGQTPYDASSSSIYEATRVIKEDAPAPLSRVNPRLRGDVETIVMKALEKNRERRFLSAGDLGADIRRYLDGRPIEARPPSFSYQMTMFARQHKALVIGSAVVFLCLIVAMLVSLDAKVDAEKERENAETRLFFARIAAAESAVLQNDLGSAGAELKDFPEERKRWEWHHLEARLNNYSKRTRVSPYGIDPYDQLLCVRWSQDSRWVLAGRRNDGYLFYDLQSKEKDEMEGNHPLEKNPDDKWGTEGVAFSPDSSRFALSFSDGHVEIGTCSIPRKLTDHHEVGDGTYPGPVVFGPQGRWVFIGTSDPEYAIRAWDTDTDCEFSLIGHSKAVKALAVSPDGKRLASGSHDHTIILWNVEDPAAATEIGVLLGHRDSVLSLDFTEGSSSGYLISGSIDGDVRIWDVMASENDAKKYGTASMGVPAAVLENQDSWVNAVAACPTSGLFAFAGGDQVVRIWQMSRAKDQPTGSTAEQPESARLELNEIVVFQGHHRQITDLDFSPDGKKVVSVSDDGSIRIWDTMNPGSVPVLAGHGSRVNEAVFSNDGRLLASAGGKCHVLVWDVETCKLMKTLSHRLEDVVDLTFCREDSLLVTASATAGRDDPDGQVCVWDWRKEDAVSDANFGSRVLALDAFDSRHQIAAGLEDGRIILWKLSPAGILGDPEQFKHHPLAITAISFSPDGLWLAYGSEDETVRIWDLETGERRKLNLTDKVRDIAFCAEKWPSKHWLAVATMDGKITLWDALSGDPSIQFRQKHSQDARSVAFSPDGTRLASGAFDGTIRLWDPTRGECALTLKSHVRRVHSVAWGNDPTGNKAFRLASTGSGFHGRDDTIKLWERKLDTSWRENRITTRREEMNCR